MGSRLRLSGIRFIGWALIGLRHPAITCDGFFVLLGYLWRLGIGRGLIEPLRPIWCSGIFRHAFEQKRWRKLFHNSTVLHSPSEFFTKIIDRLTKNCHLVDEFGNATHKILDDLIRGR